MAALTAGRPATRRKLNPGDRYRDPVVDTGETCYPGGFVGIRAGKACAADADDDYTVCGVGDGKFDDAGVTAEAGDRVRVFEGVFGPFAQTGTTITDAHIGQTVFIVDDQTVTLAGAAPARAAGKVSHVTTGGVWVETGLALCAGLDAVNALELAP